LKEAEYEARIKYHRDQLNSLINEKRSIPASVSSSLPGSFKKEEMELA